MSAVRGTYSNGTVKLKTKPDWPENMEVEVSPGSGQLGISEEEQGTDPQSIAEWIAWYRSLEPMDGFDSDFLEKDEWYKKCGYYTPEKLKELEELFQ